MIGIGCVGAEYKFVRTREAVPGSFAPEPSGSSATI